MLGAETKEETPPTPEVVVIETLSVPDSAVAEEKIVERKWKR
jgi:hypothetical protein